jgi:hypothetical protein
MLGSPLVSCHDHPVEKTLARTGIWTLSTLPKPSLSPTITVILFNVDSSVDIIIQEPRRAHSGEENLTPIVSQCSSRDKFIESSQKIVSPKA